MHQSRNIKFLLPGKQHAQRELREETGFSARRLKKFLIWRTGGWEDHAYLATDLKINPLVNDEYEDIRTYFLPFSKVYQMCLNGEIKSSHIMASIILLYQQIKRGKINPVRGLSFNHCLLKD